MKGYYTLVNNETKEEIELEHENLVDIRCALSAIKNDKNHHKGECFDETLAIINKVDIPVTDY